MRTVVHLVGGAVIELEAPADDLGEIIHQIRTERVLVGLIRDEDGLVRTALVPSGRIQLVLTE